MSDDLREAVAAYIKEWRSSVFSGNEDHAADAILSLLRERGVLAEWREITTEEFLALPDGLSRTLDFITELGQQGFHFCTTKPLPEPSDEERYPSHDQIWVDETAEITEEKWKSILPSPPQPKDKEREE
jgi:hypothetical protein